MRFILTALIFVMLAGSFQSCVSKKKFDELQASKDATDQALAETQSQVKTLGEEKDQLAADMAAEKTRMTGEMNTLRTDMTAQMGQLNEKLSMTEGELKAMKDEINGMFSTYQDSGLTMEERDGRLYLVTEDPVTFRSSSSSLTREQRNAIDAMADKMKGNPNLKVMVEGYTDDKKFAADSGTDNWDLSFARAKAVASRLIRQGVDASQIGIAGYGETMPVGDNSTTEGRKSNRRTAITPNPDLGGLMKNAGGNN
jgi:chemotaxis protein MotB